jgi:hypothetical protein
LAKSIIVFKKLFTKTLKGKININNMHRLLFGALMIIIKIVEDVHPDNQFFLGWDSFEYE